MATPILDLSYRNYDGPLEAPTYRWWPIAKSSMRLAFKKKMMWVFMVMSSLYFLLMGFRMFLVETLTAQAPMQVRAGREDQLDALFARIVWKDQFLHAFSYGQLYFLLIVLILGAGAIANDNRSNALLVYLSKPVTKVDYLIGKWVGVFLPLLMTMLIPAITFYLYGLMSYRDQGFVSQDPFLILKLLLVFPVSAAFYASLITGISSMFSQGRLAGATFAGVYFLSNFFTVAVGITFFFASGADRPGRSEAAPTGVLELIQKLWYCSIDGLNIGWMKSVMQTAGSTPFGFPGRGLFVKAPPMWLPLLGMIGLSAIAMWVAWRRIRPVEIVG
jgi:ABC-2 type transport system permease protein